MIYAVILAAGMGTRMKSDKPKAVHQILGKPMLDYVISAVKGADINNIVVVVGHKANVVKESIKSDVIFVEQTPQLGTGHAVMVARDRLPDSGTVLILTGDTPLITSNTLKKVVEYHESNHFSATVITSELNDPTGYGRIIRNNRGEIEKIVEHKDANEHELTIKEINSAMYCFNVEDLKMALDKLNNNNAQGEYYLTDTISILKEQGKRIGGYIAQNTEVMGINDRVQLYQASDVMRQRIQFELMRNGVTIINPASTYIGPDAKIGRDTVIYPNTVIEGDVTIGNDCYIYSSKLNNCKIGDNCEIINSVIVDSMIKNNVKMGPFAYIRPESEIGNDVKVGDFVEIKKSKIGEKTKVPHLTYVGDAEIGNRCNLGCGTITVNYDGKVKHKTSIGDRVFVGCNSNLVSPVHIDDDSFIAAGSTITDYVPKKSLAIARARQVIKEGWVEKRFKKRED